MRRSGKQSSWVGMYTHLHVRVYWCMSVTDSTHESHATFYLDMYTRTYVFLFHFFFHLEAPAGNEAHIFSIHSDMCNLH